MYKSMYNYIHSNISHNSKVETIQISIKCWINKHSTSIESIIVIKGIPRWSSELRICLQCRSRGFNP